MSRRKSDKGDGKSERPWLGGLIITVATIVALFGFWRLSPVPTFVIALTALIIAVIAFWRAGKRP